MNNEDAHNQIYLNTGENTAKGMSNLNATKNSGISGAYQTKAQIQGSRLKRKSQNDDLQDTSDELLSIDKKLLHPKPKISVNDILSSPDKNSFETFGNESQKFSEKIVIEGNNNDKLKTSSSIHKTLAENEGDDAYNMNMVPELQVQFNT